MDEIKPHPFDRSRSKQHPHELVSVLEDGDLPDPYRTPPEFNRDKPSVKFKEGLISGPSPSKAAGAEEEDNLSEEQIFLKQVRDALHKISEEEKSANDEAKGQVEEGDSTNIKEAEQAEEEEGAEEYVDPTELKSAAISTGSAGKQESGKLSAVLSGLPPSRADGTTEKYDMASVSSALIRATRMAERLRKKATGPLPNGVSPFHDPRVDKTSAMLSETVESLVERRKKSMKKVSKSVLNALAIQQIAEKKFSKFVAPELEDLEDGSFEDEAGEEARMNNERKRRLYIKMESANLKLGNQMRIVSQAMRERVFEVKVKWWTVGSALSWSETQLVRLRKPEVCLTVMKKSQRYLKTFGLQGQQLHDCLRLHNVRYTKLYALTTYPPEDWGDGKTPEWCDECVKEVENVHYSWYEDHIHFDRDGAVSIFLLAEDRLNWCPLTDNEVRDPEAYLNIKKGMMASGSTLAQTIAQNHLNLLSELYILCDKKIRAEAKMITYPTGDFTVHISDLHDAYLPVFVTCARCFWFLEYKVRAGVAKEFSSCVRRSKSESTWRKQIDRLVSDHAVDWLSMDNLGMKITHMQTMYEIAFGWDWVYEEIHPLGLPDHWPSKFCKW